MREIFEEGQYFVSKKHDKKCDKLTAINIRDFAKEQEYMKDKVIEKAQRIRTKLKSVTLLAPQVL